LSSSSSSCLVLERSSSAWKSSGSDWTIIVVVGCFIDPPVVHVHVQPVFFSPREDAIKIFLALVRGYGHK
jgi:hypothetical protein